MTQPVIHRRGGESSSSDRESLRPPKILANIARLALAAVFVISGTFKALDTHRFLDSLRFYHLPGFLYPGAYVLPAIEVALGLALVLGIVRRKVAVFAMTLLAGFSILLTYALFRGDLESCGCFGGLLEISPQLALLRNGLLIVLALAVFRWSAIGHQPVRTWHAWLFTVLMLAAGLASGLSARMPLIDQSEGRVGDRLALTGFAAEAPRLAGRQLVFVFNPGCPHCWNYIANVSSLAAETNLDVFAVTYAGADEIANFSAFFGTTFPIYSLNRETFLRRFRIWPSLYYLEDGVILGKIEKEVPAPHTLRKVHFPQWGADIERAFRPREAASAAGVAGRR